MRFRLLLSVAAVAAFSMVLAVAQQQGGGTGGTGTGGTGTGGTGGAGGVGTVGSTPTRPAIPSPTTTTTQPNTFPEQPRPIFLSGKVMLSEGTPPPEPVAIERICGGRVFPEGFTDSKGRFSIELGRNQGGFLDASMSSGSDAAFGSVSGSSTNPLSTRGSSSTSGGMNDR